MVEKNGIDNGRAFDWGKASFDYAKYRDIYPPEFYQKILDLGLCAPNSDVLDLGTGTGVLPRNLAGCGARFTGLDSSENQIEQARLLSRQAGLDFEFHCQPAEDADFPDNSFDTITACQCFFYFDHQKLAPKAWRLLKPGGRLAALYMAWLPFEDEIARASEELVLKYNPSWTGCRETRHPIAVDPAYEPYFELETEEQFDLQVPFTRESWNGRMKACRGIGASLSQDQVQRFEDEHQALLEHIAPEQFTILHYAAAAVLRVKK